MAFIPYPLFRDPFAGPVYRTPPGRRRSLLLHLTRRPEWAFYLPVLTTVFESRLLVALGCYGDRAWVASSRSILRALEQVGIEVVVEELDVLRSFPGPCVFVANHMSTLETFLLPSIIQPRKPVCFVVKQSLLRYPVFGPILGTRHPISVGRANPREDLTAVLTEGRARLEGGRSVIIFPTTTRSTAFHPERFNSIGAKLAARAGVPLVPLALRSDAWGNGEKVRDLGPVDPALPVRFRFGAPLAPEGKGNAAHAASSRFIRETLGSWGVPVADEQAAAGEAQSSSSSAPASRSMV